MTIRLNENVMLENRYKRHKKAHKYYFKITNRSNNELIAIARLKTTRVNVKSLVFCRLIFRINISIV